MGDFESFLLNQPVAGILIFVAATTLSAFATYGLTHRLLRERTGIDAIQMTTSIIARLGALHALILALIFAQEMADYRDISRIASREASSIIDVYTNLLLYGEEDPQSADPIIDDLVEFVQTISTEDRIALASDQLSRKSRSIYLRIDRQLRDLLADNEGLQGLRGQMLADWDNVSEFHLRILSAAEYASPAFFWLVIISGFFAVVIPCYIYTPSAGNLVLLATFAAFNGIVMYVVFSIANPFTGALAIDSHIMENVLEMMRTTPEL